MLYLLADLKGLAEKCPGSMDCFHGIEESLTDYLGDILSLGLQGDLQDKFNNFFKKISHSEEGNDNALLIKNKFKKGLQQETIKIGAVFQDHLRRLSGQVTNLEGKYKSWIEKEGGSIAPRNLLLEASCLKTGLEELQKGQRSLYKKNDNCENYNTKLIEIKFGCDLISRVKSSCFNLVSKALSHDIENQKQYTVKTKALLKDIETFFGAVVPEPIKKEVALLENTMRLLKVFYPPYFVSALDQLRAQGEEAPAYHEKLIDLIGRQLRGFESAWHSLRKETPLPLYFNQLKGYQTTLVQLAELYYATRSHLQGNLITVLLNHFCPSNTIQTIQSKASHLPFPRSSFLLIFSLFLKDFSLGASQFDRLLDRFILSVFPEMKGVIYWCHSGGLLEEVRWRNHAEKAHSPQKGKLPFWRVSQKEVTTVFNEPNPDILKNIFANFVRGALETTTKEKLLEAIRSSSSGRVVIDVACDPMGVTELSSQEGQPIIVVGTTTCVRVVLEMSDKKLTAVTVYPTLTQDCTLTKGAREENGREERKPEPLGERNDFNNKPSEENFSSDSSTEEPPSTPRKTEQENTYPSLIFKCSPEKTPERPCQKKAPSTSEVEKVLLSCKKMPSSPIFP